MSDAQLDPSHILDVGVGFWPAKTLLSAVELDLFSCLGDESMTGEEIGRRLGLHPRPVYDFLDTLVALRFLDRDGDRADGRYRNTAETAAFLVETSPAYLGGFLKMANARLYSSWGNLTKALKTGQLQSEAKHTGKPIFEELCSDPARVEQFLLAMSGIMGPPVHALVQQFDFSRYETVCDVGGAMGLACIVLAGLYPHLRCTTYDLPAVAAIAEKAVAAEGLSHRITAASGDFLAEPLPRADVVVMSRILHDWNLDIKKHLIKAAYEALPDGGAFVVIESLIDDARRENAFGLMMSLNMLVETGDGFDFTGSDLNGWCHEVGFRDFEVVPLEGPNSAGIAYK
jgi:O-methyltransferase domain/Dimerisation domain